MGIAPCWGIAGMAEKVSRDRGYRSDTKVYAISPALGPLSKRTRNGCGAHVLNTFPGDRKLKLGGFQNRGVSHFLRPEKSPKLCRRTLSATVPHRCS